MKKIETYKISWRPAYGEGIIHLHLVKGGSAVVHLHSAETAALLIDLLRNEKPVYYEAEYGRIMTGFEPVGEGEPKRKYTRKSTTSSAATKAKAKPKAKAKK